MATINAKIINNTKTQAQWIASDVILLAGELGIASDTNIIKIGNGVDLWKDLPASGVSSLNDVADVTITSAAGGQALPADTDLSHYDNTTSNFAVLSDLARVATSGSYNDLTDTPDLSVYSLITETGSVITFDYTGHTGDHPYSFKAQLRDKNNNVISESSAIDLPIESVVVSGEYDNENKKIILTLEGGSTIDVPVGDLVEGLQTQLNGTGFVKVVGTAVEYDNSTYLTTTDAATTYAALAGNNTFTGNNTFAEAVTTPGVTGNGTQDLVIGNDGKVVLKTSDNGTQVATVSLVNDGTDGALVANNATLGTASAPWEAAYVTDLYADTLTLNGVQYDHIPTATSELLNDSGFLTAADITIIDGNH